jgi:apolipoprotein N-acyltransferase
MENIAQYLFQIVAYFSNNLIALAILVIVVIIAAVKKPKELFKVVALLVLMLGVLYVLIYLEKSTFSGVSSKERSLDVERTQQK